ncbi:MAG: LptF/LptG family permease [Bacteroidales bacterium]|nr:LptF/LptG family permease [Bacteroidales bacterium]
MRKIYKLVFYSYAGPLVMTFFISLFILLMQFLWKYIDDLVGKGLEWYIIAELLFYASSTFVPLALPLAILLSSLMTFGNLGEHYELVAMKSSGISLRKIMMPLIVLSVVISVVAFYFSNNILPVANLKFKSLLFDVREQKLALDIKEGIFYDGLDGYTIRVGKKDKDGKTIRDVMIYDHSQKKGNINLTVAEWGTMVLTPDGRNLIFTLYNGENYSEKTDDKQYRNNRPFQRTRFAGEVRKFSLIDFKLSRTNEDLFKNNYQMLNITQLKESEDSLVYQFNERKEDIKNTLFNSFFYMKQLDSLSMASAVAIIDESAYLAAGFSSGARLDIIDHAMMKTRRARENLAVYKSDLINREKLIYKHQVEWHRKFTLSFACLVLFFVGAPLGAIIRKGGLGLPVVVSVLLFVMFHVISMTGEKSVKSGALDANIGMWIAPAVLLPLGVFLTYKATTDSPLLDSEAWTKLLTRFSWKKKKAHENTDSLQ